jgi:membrane-bound lytic murein transglycosylase A
VRDFKIGVYLGLLLVLSGCSSYQSTNLYSFKNNGENDKSHYYGKSYTLTPMPQIVKNDECDLKLALSRQKKYLEKKSRSYSKRVGDLRVTGSDMLRVVDHIEQWTENPKQTLSSLDAYKISGKDGYGNVQFTGYFSPVLKVSSRRTTRYSYPIYGLPYKAKPLPNREAIDFENALEGKAPILAYTNNLEDLFFMQIQGSGIVEFVDLGYSRTFAYHGSNGHRYYSIGKYLVQKGYLSASKVSMNSIKKWLKDNPGKQREVMSLNPSYVFFRQTQQYPTGATGQPVTGLCSVAVDPRYIPFGSVVIIKRPILNKKGELKRHESSVFLAQDRGGAIKGPGRVDIYMGLGKKGERLSSALKHYGELWLLLPK